jgi:hypothetical protein
MARIIIGATMVRYPLGGMNQWVLAWFLGLHKLGHEVYVVEKSGWPDACYDLSKKIMTDDCSYGFRTISALLKRFGLERRLCFVDINGIHHGISRNRVAELFKTADLFLDLEWNEWLTEAEPARLRVFVDAEPGWFQMLLAKNKLSGKGLPQYDYYYTTGKNIGSARCDAPTAGLNWRTINSPVLTDLYPYQPARPDSPFTTVMNWQSNKQIEFDGVTYGQKDVEFAKFISLPSLTTIPLEIAVSGRNVPRKELSDAGWRVRNADDVATSIDTYRDYILSSRGEFSVNKNVFVATRSGVIPDRAGYYMSSGRPAVVQETGFSEHYPCGCGLFAFSTVEEAAEAIREIDLDYERHSKRAREIALEFFDAPKVLGNFLRELGL